MSMADHEHKPDWSVTLRRQPASLSIGHPEGNTGTFEVICHECGDDPDLDYQEVSPALRQIRGPYPFTAGIAAFLKHEEHHDRTEKTEAHRARPDLAIPHRAAVSYSSYIPVGSHWPGIAPASVSTARSCTSSPRTASCGAPGRAPSRPASGTSCKASASPGRSRCRPPAC